MPLLVRMYHMKTQFSWATPTGTHGEYADKQLANLQKRILLIEFLRLGLVIGCQGAMLGLPKIKTTFWVGFLCFPILSSVRKSCVKSTTVSHIYELFYIKKLAKMTSFYTFSQIMQHVDIHNIFVDTFSYIFACATYYIHVHIYLYMPVPGFCC